MNIRTDLALELTNTNIEKNNKNDISVINTEITKELSKKVHKKEGDYVTIKFGDILDFEYSKKVEKTIINQLKKILKLKNIKENDSALIVGLGNSKSTPDALGPKTINNILVTSFLFDNIKGFRKVYAFSPGVTGNTGIETYDIISSIVKKINVKFLIVIDALKTNNKDNITNIIEISTSGISPGSGIGNKRKELSEKTLKVPVIALGVPTVTINNDLITTKINIDILIEKLSLIISTSINNALHKNVTHL